MGVDLSVLDFLLKFRGKIHGKTLQLGKQGFHISKAPGSTQRQTAEAIIRKYDLNGNFDYLAGSDGFTENLFHYLGSSEVVSMDASPYEGADLCHDLNTAVPDQYVSTFDTIFDGGTIEHIFNLPIVFENIKRMLKPEGLFLSVNAANNQLGHGFYQFSPQEATHFSSLRQFGVSLAIVA
jgi:SAM-dependent methyltransferase